MQLPQESGGVKAECERKERWREERRREERKREGGYLLKRKMSWFSGRHFHILSFIPEGGRKCSC